MGDIRNEPSMEEILASIKRIIAEDGATTPAPPPRARRGSTPLNVSFESQEATVPQPAAKPTVDDADNEEVLELTQSMDPAVTPQPTVTEPAPDARLVSESVASASRHALAALSAMVVKPEGNGENTLDGLVREMLRPMLKEWLDARLPELVEQLVEKEIARITGRAF
jgi:cell pole-organizing protein PopZ